MPSRRAGQSEGDVRRDAEVREEAAFLRDIPDLPLLGTDVRALTVDRASADCDRAPVGRLEASQQPQQGRLADPRRSEQRGERSGRDGQVQARQNGLPPEAFV